MIGRQAGALLTNGAGNLFIGNRAGYNEQGSDKLHIGNDANKIIIYGNMATGQVLLGNANPTDYTFKGSRTLNVLGGILADSVRVALSGDWADHVFKNNYRLRPLTEVEAFIKHHQHLPDIPSEKEVKAQGIQLAEMDKKLLQKVEELTLYVIELEKKLQSQQQQISELKSKGNTK